LKLSITIVIYKPNIPVLEKVLLALFNSENVNFKMSIFIIDNSAEVDWHAKIKNFYTSLQCPNWCNVNLIESPGNIGYGRANNLILNKLDSDYHLVLNPDVFVYPDTINNSIYFMDKNPKIGLLTPAVYDEAGQQQFLCKRNPTLFTMFLRGGAPSFVKKKFKRYLDRYEMRDVDYCSMIKDVPSPTGCFMFFRTEIFKKLGGFDPVFFMYYEDTDLGRRLLQISHSTYVPNVKIIHQWARETHKSWRMRWITIKSGLTYWRKWGGLY
jgi:GT2 family glycosyltransferase